MSQGNVEGFPAVCRTLVDSRFGMVLTAGHQPLSNTAYQAICSNWETHTPLSANAHSGFNQASAPVHPHECAQGTPKRARSVGAIQRTKSGRPSLSGMVEGEEDERALKRPKKAPARAAVPAHGFRPRTAQDVLSVSTCCSLCSSLLSPSCMRIAGKGGGL